jgi:hypothetical protein
VAAGGTTGQVLTKESDEDYDTTWKSPSDLGIITVVDVGTITGTPPVQVSISAEQVTQAQLENAVIQAVYQGITLHLQKIGQSATQVVFSGFVSNSNIYFFVNITSGGATFNIDTVKGLPKGGTAGQVLAKASGTDYDTEWVDQTGGGGGTDYTPGNGISIEGTTLSAKLSQAEGNAALFGEDGGIFVPESSNPYTAGPGIQIDGQTIQALISPAADNATQIYNGAIYTPATFQTTVSPSIVVSTFPSTQNIQIKATKGETVLTEQTNQDGVAEFEISNFGTWTISGNINGESVEAEVPVSKIEQYNTYLSSSNVFGVAWDTSNPSPQLVRLTKQTDPNGVVTVTVDSDPQPAIGTSEGSSPFDSFMPWSGMEQYNIINNAVSYKRGDENFSQTLYDTVVFIPQFYYRVDKIGNMEYFYIGDNPFEGASIHPGSGKYVGRYDTGNNNQTISGIMPNVSITRGELRTYALQKGENWYLYDYATWGAVWILYLIEYASWDSQGKIGMGVCGESSVIASGSTDVMNYHTGRASSDQYSAVQYRWIENCWGNMRQFLDGFNANSNTCYICTDPKYYADSTNDNYSSLGQIYAPSSGFNNYITEIGYNNNFQFAFYPTKSGNGSSTTYITDAQDYGSGGWKVLSVGGDRSVSVAGGSGMFFFDTYYATGGATGGRLVYRTGGIQ